MIGSSGAATKKRSSSDNDTLSFDQDTTQLYDTARNSGTVYVYDYINRPGDSIDTPGAFVLAQQMSPSVFSQGINFGASIDAKNGYAIIGAPTDSGVLSFAGEVYVFTNPDNLKSWQLVRRNLPKVDLKNLLRLFVYSKKTNEIQTNLDFYDPAKGKILGIAEQELDYISTYDPAQYNSNNPQIDTLYPQTSSDPRNAYQFVYVGTVSAWGEQQVGQLWWNLDAVRYIDYEQDSLTYRLNHWGEMFPGSSIDVYQWVESSTLPSAYTGPGTPLHPDDSAYSTYGYVDSNLARSQIRVL
jgi:hypothetical protein